ncbi:MAG: phosphoenolpyruvate carboxykinase (ATP) [Acidobacteriota bacterium]
MNHIGPHPSRHGLEHHGIEHAGTVHWHLPVARLYEEAIRRNEAVIAPGGPLLADTGSHTGRSPKAKFFVEEPTSRGELWWGDVNRPVSAETFETRHRQILEYFAERDLFVFDGYAGADSEHRLNVRVVNERAWHNLFARNMFLREDEGDHLAGFVPDFTILHAPGFEAPESEDGHHAGTFVLVHLGKRLILIGGTEYAGEIKKSIFTVMNYLLPMDGIMAMHCSANYAAAETEGGEPNVALFFGLSGTGKTTLSADSDRALIGDDEHGWSNDGVFNFEGGCYAKAIRLERESEPEIYATTERFGTVLENIVFDEETHQLDFFDGSKTENTRVSYPLTHLANVDLSGQTGHPSHVVFLTCDASGVLPPISRLTEAQAMYHFLSGYTAKVAGTEKGVDDPEATFSTCFGAPFMPLHPGRYAKLLGDKIRQHGAKVWLVNTGWTGGGFNVGERMKLSYTRRMVRAALAGELDGVDTVTDPIFGVAIPTAIDGVPDDVLVPRNTWADGDAFDAEAKKLARQFVDNFEQFADGCSDEICAAAPNVD